MNLEEEAKEDKLILPLFIISNCALPFSSTTVCSVFSLPVSLIPGDAALLMVHFISFHPGLLHLSSKGHDWPRNTKCSPRSWEFHRPSSLHLVCKSSFPPLLIKIDKRDYSCIRSVGTVVAFTSLTVISVVARRKPLLRTKNSKAA